jgi:SAM-dependent methyltransferase
VIRPRLVPVISYPYEWAFSQLQDAALATLAAQKLALEHGMTLRDASGYNIQFVDGRPILIDTLSFDEAKEGEPWVAYRQFCQHFLAPLALMSYRDLGLQQLLRVHIDGLPLPMTARLLPRRAKLRPGLAMHLVAHAGFQKQHESKAKRATAGNMSRNSLLGLIDSLERAVRGLKLPGVITEWGAYYQNTNYSDAAFTAKKKLVGELVRQTGARTVLDLGANDGAFSRVAAAEGARVISSDIDPLAVESNYRQVRGGGEKDILPLLIDLTNPSPALGWANSERASFTDRAHTDAVLALALIHHLAISNNLPLTHIAEYFASLAPGLIIEFVPKSDSQVKRLLATREDIFPDYTEAGLESAFGQFYELTAKHPVEGSRRTLYLMTKRSKP